MSKSKLPYELRLKSVYALRRGLRASMSLRHPASGRLEPFTLHFSAGSLLECDALDDPMELFKGTAYADMYVESVHCDLRNPERSYVQINHIDREDFRHIAGSLTLHPDTRWQGYTLEGGNHIGEPTPQIVAKRAREAEKKARQARNTSWGQQVNNNGWFAL